MSKWRDDPVWGAFGAIKDERKAKRQERMKNPEADPDGWTIHNPGHWSRDLLGYRLDYWPSTTKFRWKNRTRSGDVEGFIRNRLAEEA